MLSAVNKDKPKNVAAQILGKLGAIARQKKLSPTQRSKIARHAAKARWGKNGKRLAASHD